MQGPSNPGFGIPGPGGKRVGFNVDLCSAIATSISAIPLFLPEGIELEVLVRAQVGFTLFGSA
ncbi:hypothetical protein ASE66_18475 [Bosea sp. Root483D1]|uniref:hypothetical protein n=1 Tax=Bosea sp. Root483D1 TaxID=1736544 RepID=UPI000708B038|nr:hypothetical protein [Bosea sp. Root483D1]KRE12518.1 hypothetical protein ASE66_18475 [Bosea sp. Root483D1]